MGGGGEGHCTAQFKRFLTQRCCIERQQPTFDGHFRGISEEKLCFSVLKPRGSSYRKTKVKMTVILSTFKSDCFAIVLIAFFVLQCLTMLFQSERAINVWAFWLRWKQSELKKERSGRPSCVERHMACWVCEPFWVSTLFSRQSRRMSEKNAMCLTTSFGIMISLKKGWTTTVKFEWVS